MSETFVKCDFEFLKCSLPRVGGEFEAKGAVNLAYERVRKPFDHISYNNSSSHDTLFTQKNLHTFEFKPIQFSDLCVGFM